VQCRALSRQEVIFLVAVPLAWAVLLLFHPGGEGTEIYQDLHDKVPRWMVVHVGMMLFIPLFAATLAHPVRSWCCSPSRGSSSVPIRRPTDPPA
jgi:hypothetical protein